jgi:hypothetical protein
MLLVGCNTVGATPSIEAPLSSSCPTPATDLVDWCTRWKSVGYELHITRADDWVASESLPITEAEWLAAAEADPRIEVFSGNSGPTWQSAEGPSLRWFEGQVNIKGVESQSQVGEIAAFAANLGARLQGDDGETYDLSGRPVITETHVTSTNAD